MYFLQLRDKGWIVILNPHCSQHFNNTVNFNTCNKKLTLEISRGNILSCSSSFVYLLILYLPCTLNFPLLLANKLKNFFPIPLRSVLISPCLCFWTYYGASLLWGKGLHFNFAYNVRKLIDLFKGIIKEYFTWSSPISSNKGFKMIYSRYLIRFKIAQLSTICT